MNAYYNMYKIHYKETIKAMVNSVDIKLVAYDETEHFHDY
jgi:hypothetical protein